MTVEEILQIMKSNGFYHSRMNVEGHVVMTRYREAVKQAIALHLPSFSQWKNEKIARIQSLCEQEINALKKTGVYGERV